MPSSERSERVWTPCYAVLKKWTRFHLGSNNWFLGLAFNTVNRKVVVRNYLRRHWCAEAHNRRNEIAAAHDRYCLAYYERAPLSVVSCKRHWTCSQHRFKTRIPRKTTSEIKLHNFKLTGGTECRPTSKASGVERLVMQYWKNEPDFVSEITTGFTGWQSTCNLKTGL